MGINIWGRIGTRLYLALALAVVLTLFSSGVGVYYFEKSGDLNYQVREESFPLMESVWSVNLLVDRLRVLGLSMVTSGAQVDSDGVDAALQELTVALSHAVGVPGLSALAEKVNEDAYEMASLMDQIAVLNAGIVEASNEILRDRNDAASWSPSDHPSMEAQEVLISASFAENKDELDQLWDRFVFVSTSGIDSRLFDLGDGEGIFSRRGHQLLLQGELDGLDADFSAVYESLGLSTDNLVGAARVGSFVVLESSLASFDRGRVLLAAISVASVILATLTAWLWVGNGIVSPLSVLLDRTRAMSKGDVRTPVPVVGKGDVGELASSLEIFREWAYEVQRLNLVEKLYGELRDAHAEMRRMQEQLVVQGKLAALGELVSGIAHEIRNPLSFVKNFSEGSQELYGELREMLQSYREDMSEDDQELLDDISEEINSSLDRVNLNGSRMLAIVDQMQNLGVSGGLPAMSDLNLLVGRAAQLGCDSFLSEWTDFDMKPVLQLDSKVGEVNVVPQDLSKALVNLVMNACYSMRDRREEGSEGYVPVLEVSSMVSPDGYEVKVRDNGTGISDDILDQIFNPFFTTRSGVLGAGLGLLVSADIARRCGGFLTVDTEFGSYAEFTFTIPAG